MSLLLVDMSSVMWMSLLAGKDQEFGREVVMEVEKDGDTVQKKVWVNGWQFGMECATNHISSVLRELELEPKNMIIVREGAMSKTRRKTMLPEYKDGRDARPEESYEQFNILREKLAEYYIERGATVLTQDGVEADDVIAYLAQKSKTETYILSNDGDMVALTTDRVHLYKGGKLLSENPYGPFPSHFVTVYKALVGDSSDNIKGAPGFGPKAFLDFLVFAGNPGLAALEGMINRQTLHELEDDVADFKPLKKIIDGAQHVYKSYAVAKMYPEWVNTERQPLKLVGGDERILNALKPAEKKVVFAEKNHGVFDCELIGSENPVFLTCIHVLETGERQSYWWHKEGDMAALKERMTRGDVTWISFNGIHFDQPLISAAVSGKHPKLLKILAQSLIEGELRHWQASDRYDYDFLDFDHVDLMEVSPGVKISLKTFAGRMGYKTMIDLPFHHDRDLNEEECVVLETYCQNDLGVTQMLFEKLRSEIELRKEMSQEHGIDLRSKSDAQVAEAILKKVCDIKKRASGQPKTVTYKAPDFIDTQSDVLLDLIDRIERTDFTINEGNGMVESPEFMDEPIQLGYGTYQFGVGGLHSTHDKRFYVEATEDMCVSDFDVASYYPNIMLKANLIPRLEGGAGERFIEEYRKIYDRRIEAKRSGDKKTDKALKISLNGTFGKLGSLYCAFYSPDLMLGVTITGQLNLAQLIYELEYRPDVKVTSANTDGIMLHYPASQRDRVLNIILENAKRTGFDYEETRYAKVAMKDVNNYIAVPIDLPTATLISGDSGITIGKGKMDVKRKGLYAEKGLMKNPTMEVCSLAAAEYLLSGADIREFITSHTEVEDFMAIRNVKGGGIQYESMEMVDDWVEVAPGEWSRQDWIDRGVKKATVKRKSRPKPVEVGVGGVPFGRLARWYMVKGGALPINYVESGNRVPKTDGAKLCLTLPDAVPEDLDWDWYVAETISMLNDMGVVVSD